MSALDWAYEAADERIIAMLEKAGAVAAVYKDGFVPWSDEEEWYDEYEEDYYEDEYYDDYYYSE
jgi:hypothetical protein